MRYLVCETLSWGRADAIYYITKNLRISDKILLTLIILRRPLLIVFAAEQAWLLWCLEKTRIYSDLLFIAFPPNLNCLQEHKFEFSVILKLVVWMLISLSCRGCCWTIRSPFLSPFLPQLLSDGLDKLEDWNEKLHQLSSDWPDWYFPVLM